MSKEAALAALTGTTPAPQAVMIHTPEAKFGETIATGAEIPPESMELKSKRFAEFAKKEAEIVREREAIKKEKERLKDFYTKAQSFEEKRKAGDFMGALKDVGLSETDIFNMMAEGQPEKKEPTAEEIAKRVADETLNSYKKEQADLQSKIDQEKNQSIVANFKKSITSTIEAAKEKFEYVHFNGAVAEDLVYSLINKVLTDSGGTDLISIDEALELVEDHYEEQDKAMSNLKKRQSKLEAPVEEGVKKAPDRVRTLAPQLGKSEDKPKTLTNKVTPTAQSTLPRRETHEQKKARLIQALKNGAL